MFKIGTIYKIGNGPWQMVVPAGNNATTSIILHGYNPPIEPPPPTGIEKVYGKEYWDNLCQNNH